MKELEVYVNKSNGHIIMIITMESCATSIQMEPEEFAEFVSTINGAFGESKMAAK